MNCDDNVYSIAAWRMQFALYIVTLIIILPVFTGLSCLPCIGKDQIKSVPSSKTSVSASRRFRFVPVLDNWCQKWDWRRDGTDEMATEDNPARLWRAVVAACRSPCVGGHAL